MNPCDVTIEFRLLGNVDFESAAALQERLWREAALRDAPRMVVLLCEHPRRITVGRAGSRSDVKLSDEQLRRKQLTLQWTPRGGGCILHGPGQLAIHTIAPLATMGWSVGRFARGLSQGIADATASVGVPAQRQAPHLGLWGRTGQLAAVGLSVRDGVACGGAYLNVNPAMPDYVYVENRLAAGGAKRTMSCLAAERRQAGTMHRVRAALLPALAEAWEVERYHLHTGHPYLAQIVGTARETARIS